MTRVDPPTCPHCDRPNLDMAYVCAERAAQLVDRLLLLARLAGETDAQVAKLARGGPATAGAPPTGDGRPLPYNDGAAANAWAAASTVTTWASDIAYRRGIDFPTADPRPRPPGPLCRPAAGCGHDSCETIRDRVRLATVHPVARLALWLVRHVDWMRRQPDAGDAVDELVDAVRLVERTVDRRPDRWYAGACGEPYDVDDQGAARVVECPGELYAMPAARTIRCPMCEATHDAGERREWLLAESRPTELTAAAAAGAATILTGRIITAARVRGLAFRRRLLPVDPASNPPTYRFGDLLDLLEQQRPEVVNVKPAAAATTPKPRSSAEDLTKA